MFFLLTKPVLGAIIVFKLVDSKNKKLEGIEMEKTNKIVFEIEHGKEVIMGTAWPISSFVEKRDRGGWLATYRLCNGVPDGSKIFKTKREAIESIIGE
jgi:hypothetical protein